MYACVPVSQKGTKNKVGLIEAFEDMDPKGFNWNNMMVRNVGLDLSCIEHRVLDDIQETKKKH